ncbi:hypothetical protein [Tepidibacillus marianensis]|uniref:prenylated flavin chaperone LpdD n=1 Tax=Tepidibacillus marianensis TaxID=3131995 RepID=UPI0030CE2D1E
MNRFNIQIKQYNLGKDLVIHVTGGAAHIGAVATAYFDEDQLHVELLQLPHHKEGELAEEFAELAARKLRSTVTVLMGIHIDHATKEDIQNIIEEVKIGMEEVVSKFA